MAVLGGEFAVILLISGPPGAIEGAKEIGMRAEGGLGLRCVLEGDRSRRTVGVPALPHRGERGGPAGHRPGHRRHPRPPRHQRRVPRIAARATRRSAPPRCSSSRPPSRSRRRPSCRRCAPNSPPPARTRTSTSGSSPAAPEAMRKAHGNRHLSQHVAIAIPQQEGRVLRLETPLRRVRTANKSALGRIRTYAHGSGGRFDHSSWPGEDASKLALTCAFTSRQFSPILGVSPHPTDFSRTVGGAFVIPVRRGRPGLGGEQRPQLGKGLPVPRPVDDLLGGDDVGEVGDVDRAAEDLP